MTVIQLLKGLAELQAAALTSGGNASSFAAGATQSTEQDEQGTHSWKLTETPVVCDTTRQSNTCPRFPCLKK